MPARDICGAIVEEWKDARMWRAMWTLLQNLDINAQIVENHGNTIILNRSDI